GATRETSDRRHEQRGYAAGDDDRSRRDRQRPPHAVDYGAVGLPGVADHHVEAQERAPEWRGSVEADHGEPIEAGGIQVTGAGGIPDRRRKAEVRWTFQRGGAEKLRKRGERIVIFSASSSVFSVPPR